jgi:hypothetical protein
MREPQRKHVDSEDGNQEEPMEVTNTVKETGSRRNYLKKSLSETLEKFNQQKNF